MSPVRRDHPVARKAPERSATPAEVLALELIEEFGETNDLALGSALAQRFPSRGRYTEAQRRSWGRRIMRQLADTGRITASISYTDRCGYRYALTEATS